jgi:hypothetical protein
MTNIIHTVDEIIYEAYDRHTDLLIYKERTIYFKSWTPSPEDFKLTLTREQIDDRCLSILDKKGYNVRGNFRRLVYHRDLIESSYEEMMELAELCSYVGLKTNYCPLAKFFKDFSPPDDVPLNTLFNLVYILTTFNVVPFSTTYYQILSKALESSLNRNNFAQILTEFERCNLSISLFQRQFDVFFWNYFQAHKGECLSGKDTFLRSTAKYHMRGWYIFDNFDQTDNVDQVILISIILGVAENTPSEKLDKIFAESKDPFGRLGHALIQTDEKTRDRLLLDNWETHQCLHSLFWYARYLRDTRPTESKTHMEKLWEHKYVEARVFNLVEYGDKKEMPARLQELEKIWIEHKSRSALYAFAYLTNTVLNMYAQAFDLHLQNIKLNNDCTSIDDAFDLVHNCKYEPDSMIALEICQLQFKYNHDYEAYDRFLMIIETLDPKRKLKDQNKKILQHMKYLYNKMKNKE